MIQFNYDNHSKSFSVVEDTKNYALGAIGIGAIGGGLIGGTVGGVRKYKKAKQSAEALGLKKGTKAYRKYIRKRVLKGIGAGLAIGAGAGAAAGYGGKLLAPKVNALIESRKAAKAAKVAAAKLAEENRKTIVKGMVDQHMKNNPRPKLNQVKLPRIPVGLLTHVPRKIKSTIDFEPKFKSKV